MADNVIRKFGYNRAAERPHELEEYGTDPELLLNATREQYPNHNPYVDPWTWLLWQGNQGACQGHALSQAPQIAMTQKYGLQMQFSRAQAYYESQRIDGINGDRGSTLRGGQKLITDTGVCLEREWSYPSRYNSRRPAGYDSMPKCRMSSSQIIRDAQLAWDLLEAGAMIQTGVTWNNSFESATCDRYRRGAGGGHSTYLFGLNEQTGNAIHHNSWRGWQGDGRNEWTQQFFSGILAGDRWSVFIAYSPTDVDPDEELTELTVEL